VILGFLHKNVGYKVGCENISNRMQKDMRSSLDRPTTDMFTHACIPQELVILHWCR